MGQKWTIQDRPEWDIEAIVLDRRQVLRVRLHRSLIGYAATMADLETMLTRYGLTLADLVEVPERPPAG